MAPTGARGRNGDGERDPDRYRDRYGELLGIDVVEVGDGRAGVALTADERHANFLGLVHGGAVFSLADAALAAASNSEAEREHSGGRLALYRITVVRLPDRELVAVAEGQVAIVAGRSS